MDYKLNSKSIFSFGDEFVQKVFILKVQSVLYSTKLLPHCSEPRSAGSHAKIQQYFEKLCNFKKSRTKKCIIELVKKNQSPRRLNSRLSENLMNNYRFECLVRSDKYMHNFHGCMEI